MKKRVLSVLLAAAMLSTLLAGCEKKPEAAADGTEAAGGDVVTIGVFEPASGDNGAGGKQERRQQAGHCPFPSSRHSFRFIFHVAHARRLPSW